MGLALAPQCCCGFPGFFRWGMNYAFVDLNRVDEFGCSQNWAPWMVSDWFPGVADGCVFYTHAMGTATLYSLLGYDSHRDRLFLTNSYDFWPTSRVSEGGISYCILSNVVDGLPTIIELINDTDGQDILDGSDPTSGTPLDIKHYWSDYSNGRLYGFTTWFADASDEYHFKAWSVLADGTDYAETCDLAADSGDSSQAVPFSMCVANGKVLTLETTGDGDFKIRRDGSLVATMTAISLLPTVWFGFGWSPLSEVDNQIFMIARNTSPFGSSFDTLTIVLVDDGGTQASQALQFVASEDDVDVEYYPLRIGWDERANAGVIMWGRLSPGYGQREVGVYVTYHTRALEPGNILTQMDHVKVYACLPFGGDFYGNCTYGFGVVIPGKMPPALVVTGRVITPPPPPPPTPPACDALDECTDLVATGGIRLEYDTVTDGAGSDAYVASFDGRTWYYGNFNRNFDCELISGGIPLGVCTGSGTGLLYDFWCNLTEGYDGDYDHPGILLIEYDHGDPTIHRETYISDIIFGVSCVDGQLRLERILFAFQMWYGEEGGTPAWPPTGYATGWHCDINLGWGYGDTMVQIGPGYVNSDTGCQATESNSVCVFDDWLQQLAGDKICSAFIQIGPTA